MTQEVEARTKPWQERLEDLLRESKLGVLSHPTADFDIKIEKRLPRLGKPVWTIVMAEELPEQKRTTYYMQEGFGLQTVITQADINIPGINDRFFENKRRIKITWLEFSRNDQDKFQKQACNVVSFIENCFFRVLHPREE